MDRSCHIKKVQCVPSTMDENTHTNKACHCEMGTKKKSRGNGHTHTHTYKTKEKRKKVVIRIISDLTVTTDDLE